MCTDTALKVSQFLYFFTSISHGVGSYLNSLGCGVWASLITFLLFISPLKVYFFLFSGRSEWRSPGNSGLGVFKLKYFTHSVAVSWEFFICLRQDYSLKLGYLVIMNQKELF